MPDGFSDPILAGNTLVREAIQSEPYSPSVEGWQIARSGSAEFNDVIVRGSVSVSGEASSNLNISNEAGLPRIFFQNSLGTGFRIQAETTGAVDGAGGSLRLQGDNAGTSSLYIVAGKGIAFRRDGTNQSAVLFDDTDGFLKRGAFSGWAVTGWTNLSLQNSWVVSVQPQYKIYPDGDVALRGRITGGTNTVGTIVGNTPVGYRTPIAGGHRFVCATGTSTTQYPCIQVEDDGDLVIAAVGGTTSIQLDGIRFSTLA